MKICILSWWTWLEREVALKSAATFKSNISNYDYFVLPEEIDAFLVWYKTYDIVIPVFHWEYWEDWMIFWLLESLWIRHCFSHFKTHAICMDKRFSNSIAEKDGILVPKGKLINFMDELGVMPFDFPMIVKPNSWWSSFSTHKVKTKIELEAAVKDVFDKTKDSALVQQFISWTEYSVPIIWNDELEVLPIMKVALDKSEFFDFEEKYNSSWSNEIFESLEPSLQQTLEMQSKKIYKLFGCKWIARIDYIVNSEWCYFLEVNTIPWFTQSSIFPKSWNLTWRSLKELISKIISLGFT